MGYVAYADRFAGTLAGVRERLPYLRELGVTYLHLMPLLRARPGAQRRRLRGRRLRRGRAGARARWTTCARWRARCTTRRHGALRRRRRSTTPRASTRGRGPRAPATRRSSPSTARSPTARSPTPTRRTLPEVFPDTAPGSFTCVAGARPLGVDDVQRLPVGPRLRQPRGVRRDGRARCSTSPRPGVDVLRLDAVPFLWKRIGTDCQNQPEVHQLLQAFRAVLRIAAPARRVQGGGDRRPRASSCATSGRAATRARSATSPTTTCSWSCGWSALASRPRRSAHADAAGDAARAARARAGSTYVRCHDDIGWAITDEDAARVGEDAHLHRRFLADFYAGDFPGSFARGARFQPDPRTGEARTSGTRRLARRPRGGARVRRRAGGRSSPSGASCSCTRSPSPTAGCR